MTQYALDIGLPIAYAPEQFVISESNKLAHQMVARWPHWSAHALFLQGEHGAGKTHLAHIWEEKTHATFLAQDSEELPAHAIIVENIDEWSNETALFHLLNHTKLAGIPLLITSSVLPDALPFTLPDVRSRLCALPLAIITPPDDTLLAAVLTKQLSDRQLKIAPDVVQYMLPRLPRSYAALTSLMVTLDNISLEAGRTLTIPYVRQVCGW